MPKAHILTIGLASFQAPPGTPPPNFPSMASITAELESLGYAHAFQGVAGGDKVAQSAADVRAQLRAQDWDAVLVGYGVRGIKELTPLFEAVVGVVAAETFGRGRPVKLLFPTSPDLVVETVKRGFEAEEGST